MHETREISRSGAHNNGVVDHRHKIMMDCLHCMSSHRFEFISVGSTNFRHVSDGWVCASVCETERMLVLQCKYLTSLHLQKHEYCTAHWSVIVTHLEHNITRMLILVRVTIHKTGFFECRQSRNARETNKKQRQQAEAAADQQIIITTITMYNSSKQN